MIVMLAFEVEPPELELGDAGEPPPQLAIAIVATAIAVVRPNGRSITHELHEELRLLRRRTVKRPFSRLRKISARFAASLAESRRGVSAQPRLGARFDSIESRRAFGEAGEAGTGMTNYIARG